MAYNNYCILSNTGAIGGGYKIQVKYGTWKRSKPGYQTFVGLDGGATLSIGAVNSKWTWEFVAQVNVTPATGYASLAQLETYITSQTASLRLLKFQDVYGTVFDVLSVGTYAPDPLAGDTYGANEPYECAVKLVQI